MFIVFAKFTQMLQRVNLLHSCKSFQKFVHQNLKLPNQEVQITFKTPSAPDLPATSLCSAQKHLPVLSGIGPLQQQRAVQVQQR